MGGFGGKVDESKARAGTDIQCMLYPLGLTFDWRTESCMSWTMQRQVGCTGPANSFPTNARGRTDDLVLFSRFRACLCVRATPASGPRPRSSEGLEAGGSSTL